MKQSYVPEAPRDERNKIATRVGFVSAGIFLILHMAGVVPGGAVGGVVGFTLGYALAWLVLALVSFKKKARDSVRRGL